MTSCHDNASLPALKRKLEKWPKTDLVTAGFKSQKHLFLALKSSWLCFQLSNLRDPNEFRQHEHRYTQTAKHPALHPTLERRRGENYILVECFCHEPSVTVWCRVPSQRGAAEVRVTGVRRSLCDRNESRSHRFHSRLFKGGRVWCVCVQ